MDISRRQILVAGVAFGTLRSRLLTAHPLRHQIGIGQYSFRREFISGSLNLDNFPNFIRETFGVDSIEWTSGLLPDPKATSEFEKLARNTRSCGIRNLAVLVNGPILGQSNAAHRRKVVDSYLPWIDVAHRLKCSSMRVNAWGDTGVQASNLVRRIFNTGGEQAKHDCAESMQLLLEAMSGSGIKLLVENHVDYSSQADWLAGLIELVASPNCRVMLDFGNWLSFGPMMWPRFHDAVKSCQILAPYAASVSAKAHLFNSDGSESEIDYPALINILKLANYKGPYVAEFEPSNDDVDAVEGVNRTLALLERTIMS